jgi:N-acetylmuramoyl-L-alanine amidase
VIAAVLACARAVPLVITVASARGEVRVPVRAERGFPSVAAAQLSTVLSVGVEGPAEDGAVRVLGRPMAFVPEAMFFRFEGRVFPLAAPAYVLRDSLFVPLQWAVDYLPRLFRGRFRWDAVRNRLEEGAEGVPLAAGAPRPTVRAVTDTAGRFRRRVVALDAGHGGPDVGMTGPLGRRQFLREKDVTLAIVRDAARELERRGIGVVLTRDADTLVALRDRGRLASRMGADVFVSVHVNAANPRWRGASEARGFETYFLAEARTEDAARVARMENESVRFETTADAPAGDPLSFILNDLAQNEHLRESSRMAEIVQEELGRVHPAESRGVKQAGFWVLTTSFMPAVLVEVGFGSNETEARYLTGRTGQQRLARALAAGVERYLSEYERRLADAAPERRP